MLKSATARPGMTSEEVEPLAPVQLRQSLRLGEVIDGVGVEERIERLGRPCHGGEPVARGPAVDLSDIFHHQRVAQLVAQGHAPQSDYRMRSSAGGGDRK